MRARYGDSVRRVEGLTRDEVCARYRSKVLLLARRVHERLSPDAAVQLDDLVSNGALGLLEAFDRFDAARGIQFSTYAEYRIRGAIYDDLRKGDTFTRRRRELAKRVNDARETLRREHDREPDPQEIADYLDVPLEKYHRFAQRVKPIAHVSLDAPGDGDDDARPLVERLTSNNMPSPDAALRIAEVREALAAAVGSLPDRPRNCVQMYYGRDMSLAEIAAVYGVTVSRISQILSEARLKLRKKLEHVVDPSDLTLEHA